MDAVLNSALVTGGAGFIGSHLSEQLLRSGWSVTAIDNFDDYYPSRIKRQNIRSMQKSGRFQLLEIDIRHLEQLASSIMGRYDVIFHLAARPGVRPSIHDPLTCYDINVRGTHNLLETARRVGTKRFVFASSSSVYGLNKRVPWVESDQELLPISPYASSKISCELLGQVYSHQFEMAFTALRLFTVYGSRQRPDLAINKFTRLLLDGDPVSVFGDGTTVRDYTHVSDVVSAFLSAVRFEEPGYRVINVASGRPVQLTSLIEAMEEVLGVQGTRQYMDEQPGDVPQTWANIEVAREELDYAPSMSLHEGLSEFTRWYLNSIRKPTPQIAS